MPTSISQRTQWLKATALRHGFMGVGISRAEHMDEEAKHLEDWLSKGYHGEMGYMANHFEMRVDPTKLVPGSKSVISLMYNYFPASSTPPSKRRAELVEVGVGGESTPPSKGVGGESTPPSKGVGGMKISRYAY